MCQKFLCQDIYNFGFFEASEELKLTNEKNCNVLCIREGFKLRPFLYVKHNNFFKNVSKLLFFKQNGMGNFQVVEVPLKT
jgi:hypothetical protein